MHHLHPTGARFGLVLTLCFFAADVQAQSQNGPVDLHFEDRTLQGGIYTTEGTITAERTVVSSDTRVTFRSAGTVRLLPGFHAEAGSTLRLQADPSAEGLALGAVPPWQGNERFHTSVIQEVRHPSLSLNGFDCDARCSLGLGLKQVLETLFSGGADQPFVDVYQRVLELETELGYDDSPSDDEDIEANTQVLQARAFIALASYLLEQNGAAAQETGLPAHNAALRELKAALLNAGSWSIDKAEQSDAVKWSDAVSNVARTLDLYLALENAYQHFGDADYANRSATRLLSASEKRLVLQFYGLNLWRLEEMGSEGYGNLDEYLLDMVTGIDAYDVQPGNWPLKVQAAVGYGSLVQQDAPALLSFDLNDAKMVRRALEASLRTAGNNRYHYWNYQTDDGKRFWAEGPYYMHFALDDVVSFWHAVRINDMLGWHPEFNAPDPFHTTKFTRPLHWLADLVTPDGMTPPLDDGNRHTMPNSVLLRWTSDYGERELGQKFAWIADHYEFGADNDLLLVELAIPRLPKDAGREPLWSVGNIAAHQTGEDGEQQLVLRRPTTRAACKDVKDPGECHYVLLNGESGDAYGRGEGHEQPDQLQLLYYVDGVSFLMDSGYDQGGTVKPDGTLVTVGLRFGGVLGAAVGALANLRAINSTWNHYYDHNVMQELTTEGGLPAPEIKLINDGARKSIDGQDVGYLYQTLHKDRDDGAFNEGVAVLHGYQYLPYALYGLDGKKIGARYEREVLFVNGPDPYLIDFNRIHHDHSIRALDLQNRYFRMSYHVNSNVLDLSGYATSTGGFVRWRNVRGSGKDLHLFPVGIEYMPDIRYDDARSVDDTSRELFRSRNTELYGAENLAIQRLDLWNHNSVGGKWRTYDRFSLASIIQARAGEQPYTPKLLWDSWDETRNQRYQGWVWQQSDAAYDVFVARSKGASSSFAVAFTLRDAGAAFPDASFELPAGKDYGFARVVQREGRWRIDENYWIGFVPIQSAPAAKMALARARLAEGAKPLPKAFALEAAFPNPSTTSVTLPLALPKSSSVRVEAYNAMGRRVAVLAEGERPAGWHRLHLDGERLASGLYFVRAQIDAWDGTAHTFTQKVVLVK